MALSSKSKEIRPSSGKWDGRILQCHQKKNLIFLKIFCIIFIHNKKLSNSFQLKATKVALHKTYLIGNLFGPPLNRL